MTQFRVFIDDSSPAGQQTISGIQTQGGSFGVGISSNITAGVVTASSFVGDGSNLFNIIAAGSGVQVRDDNTIVGTAATLNFGSNLDVSFSAGTATVSGASSVSAATTAYGLAGVPNLNVGVVTATTFYGNFSGNLSGVSSAVSDTININTSGIITASAFYGNFNGNLTGVASSVSDTININTSGIITASAFYGVGVPQNLQTSSYTLNSSDAGKHVAISTGGVSLNASVFDVGDAVTIYNDSLYTQMIRVGTGVTMRRVSIGDTGNRGLNSYGLATILCIGTNSYIISGAGVT